MAVNIKKNWMLLPKKKVVEANIDIGQGDHTSFHVTEAMKKSIESELILAKPVITVDVKHDKALLESLKESIKKGGPILPSDAYGMAMAMAFQKTSASMQGMTAALKQFGSTIDKVNLGPRFLLPYPFPSDADILDDFIKAVVVANGGEVTFPYDFFENYGIAAHKHDYSWSHPMEPMRYAVANGAFDSISGGMAGHAMPFFLTNMQFVVEKSFIDMTYRFCVDMKALQPETQSLSTLDGEFKVVVNGPPYVQWVLLGGPKHGEKLTVDARRTDLSVAVQRGSFGGTSIRHVSKLDVVVYRMVPFIVDGRRYCFGIVEDSDLEAMTPDEVIRYIEEVKLKPCN